MKAQFDNMKFVMKVINSSINFFLQFQFSLKNQRLLLFHFFLLVKFLKIDCIYAVFLSFSFFLLDICCSWAVNELMIVCFDYYNHICQNYSQKIFLNKIWNNHVLTSVVYKKNQIILLVLTCRLDGFQTDWVSRFW